MILNRVPDHQECDDFHNNPPLIVLPMSGNDSIDDNNDELPSISDDYEDGDADSDEIQDHLHSWFDDDADNDGIPDDQEDEDGDGILDHLDDDDDNDGIPDYSDSDALGLIVEGSGYSLFED